MKTELKKPLVWEIQHSVFSWGDVTTSRCLRPTAAAQSIHASCGCAAVLALPKAAVPGSAWMVHLMHWWRCSSFSLERTGGMAMRTISLCSGLGELGARELNKPGEGIRLRDGSNCGWWKTQVHWGLFLAQLFITVMLLVATKPMHLNKRLFHNSVNKP